MPKRSLVHYTTLILLCLSMALYAQDPYSGHYAISKTKRAPTLDGKLGKNEWTEAPFQRFQKKYCVSNLEWGTQAALLMDEKNLYIAIICELPKEIELRGKKRDFDDTNILGDDLIELVFYRDGAPVYYHIALNFFDSAWDALVRIQRGELDISWQSGITYAMGMTSGMLHERTYEIKIPLKSLHLSTDHNDLRFNISRVHYAEKKIEEPIVDKKKKEDVIKRLGDRKVEAKEPKKVLVSYEASFFPIGANTHVYSALGYAQAATPAQNDSNQAQMLEGFASQIASLDVYYKAVNKIQALIPEGSEVGHGATLQYHDHIPVSQWPTKIDGYMRTYLATKAPEYLSFSQQILGKLELLMSSTKDYQGREWIPYWDLVDWKGVAHGYDRGPKNTRYKMGVPYDQSKAKFAAKNNKFIDSFGFGFFQLSLVKEDLPLEFQNRCILFLKKMIDFYHRDYMLYEKEDRYFWRTSDFTPANPEPLNDQYIIHLLGSDILYLMLAYLNLADDHETTELCITSLSKFSKFYQKVRRELGIKNYQNSDWTNKPLWRIEYLDGRMLHVSQWAQKSHRSEFQDLVDFMERELANLYQYDQKVLFAEDGLLDTSDATTQLLPIYAAVAPQKFHELWRGFVHGALTPRGALPKGYLIQGMNSSSYPIFLAYAHEAWQNRLMTDDELIYITNKMYAFWGMDEALRDNTDWVQELNPADKSQPHWRATPDENYVEGVMSEGLWKNSEAHGYLLDWTVYMVGSNQQPYYESDMDRIFRNDYIQFTAPFQSHAEPFAYGDAFTFNTLQYQSEQREESKILVKYKKPNLPETLHCFGVLDVTDIYYEGKKSTQPTKSAITTVSCEGKTLPFKVIGCPEIEGLYSNIDSKRLVFLLPNHKPGELSIEVTLVKTEKFLEEPTDD